MTETFPVKLLKRVLDSTLEERAAIDLFFGGHGFPDRQSSTRPVALLAAHRPDHRRYALEKGQGAWALTYDGAPVAFVDRAGMDFVSYYLKHPREPIHSLDLLEAALPDIHHRTNDEAFKTTRSVRQAIRRVCLSLAEAVDEQHRPHPVLTAFAAHLQKHLLGPSQPEKGPNRRLESELCAPNKWRATYYRCESTV